MWACVAVCKRVQMHVKENRVKLSVLCIMCLHEDVTTAHFTDTFYDATQ